MLLLWFLWVMVVVCDTGHLGCFLSESLVTFFVSVALLRGLLFHGKGSRLAVTSSAEVELSDSHTDFNEFNNCELLSLFSPPLYGFTFTSIRFLVLKRSINQCISTKLIVAALVSNNMMFCAEDLLTRRALNFCFWEVSRLELAFYLVTGLFTAGSLNAVRKESFSWLKRDRIFWSFCVLCGLQLSLHRAGTWLLKKKKNTRHGLQPARAAITHKSMVEVKCLSTK